MARRVMNQVETVQMSKLMEAHIRVVPVPEGAAPLCEYEEGWDDERVAAQIAPDLNHVHAKSLRKNLFGNLYSLDAKVDPARVALIEQKLADALKLIDELITKHNALCMGITAARGGSIDAKHMRVGKVA